MWKDADVASHSPGEWEEIHEILSHNSQGPEKDSKHLSNTSQKQYYAR
jgi:hypothetical protein